MVRSITRRSLVQRAGLFMLLIFALLYPAPSDAIVHVRDEGDPGDGVLDPAKLEGIESSLPAIPAPSLGLVRPGESVVRMPGMVFVGHGSVTHVIWGVHWMPQWTPQWIPTPFRYPQTPDRSAANSGRGW
jgi:hypothetical protein